MAVPDPSSMPAACREGLRVGLDSCCVAIWSTYAATESFWLSCSLNLMKMTDNAAVRVPAKKEDISQETAPGGAEIDALGS